jgi:acyl transferase domain-containing protein
MAPNTTAIVGVSFKMPQGVETEDGLWEVLQQRKSTMTRWPESRLNIAAFHDTDPDRTDKVK